MPASSTTTVRSPGAGQSDSTLPVNDNTPVGNGVGRAAGVGARLVPGVGATLVAAVVVAAVVGAVVPGPNDTVTAPPALGIKSSPTPSS